MAVSDRRKRERERRRAEILAAAAEVFAERGVDGAAMDAIAERAELGKATLYYYFRTKEALHAAVIADATEQFFLELTHVERRHDDLGDLVEAVLLAYGRFIEEQPTLLRVISPYLSSMHWDEPPAHLHPGGPPAEVADQIPTHQRFIGEFQRLLARSPWADRPEQFTRYLTGAFVALGQLAQTGHGDQLPAQLRFHIDLIRNYRADEEGPTP